MRVALFTETYYPDINGVAAHVDTVRRGLEKLGHEVLVVAADKTTRHHYLRDGVLHCPALKIKRFYGFGAAMPVSRKRQRMIADFDPDVIHIHHEFGIGLSGLQAAKRLRKPLVYTLHTMYDKYIFYIAPRFMLGAATKFSHKYTGFIAKRATALIGPSKKCDEYFKEIGATKPMNLIPNSVDLELFDRSKLTTEQFMGMRDKLGIPRDRFIVCFCGRLGGEKSVDVLLQYFGKMTTPEDNMHMLIIGDGPDRESLGSIAEVLGIADRVTFTGLVPHEQMPLHFACCDVWATASLSEMNSISMLEGMASGLPVLQRYDELNADQIQVGENGYLYHTAEEFAQHLRDIKALPDNEREALRQRVIRSVTSRGTSELASYMLTIYEQARKELETAPTVKVRKKTKQNRQ